MDIGVPLVSVDRLSFLRTIMDSLGCRNSKAGNKSSTRHCFTSEIQDDPLNILPSCMDLTKEDPLDYSYVAEDESQILNLSLLWSSPKQTNSPLNLTGRNNVRELSFMHPECSKPRDETAAEILYSTDSCSSFNPMRQYAQVFEAPDFLGMHELQDLRLNANSSPCFIYDMIKTNQPDIWQYEEPKNYSLEILQKIETQQGSKEFDEAYRNVVKKEQEKEKRAKLAKMERKQLEQPELFSLDYSLPFEPLELKVTPSQTEEKKDLQISNKNLSKGTDGACDLTSQKTLHNKSFDEDSLCFPAELFSCEFLSYEKPVNISPVKKATFKDSGNKPTERSKQLFLDSFNASDRTLHVKTAPDKPILTKNKHLKMPVSEQSQNVSIHPFMESSAIIPGKKVRSVGLRSLQSENQFTFRKDCVRKRSWQDVFEAEVKRIRPCNLKTLSYLEPVISVTLKERKSSCANLMTESHISSSKEGLGKNTGVRNPKGNWPIHCGPYDVPERKIESLQTTSNKKFDFWNKPSVGPSTANYSTFRPDCKDLKRGPEKEMKIHHTASPSVIDESKKLYLQKQQTNSAVLSANSNIAIKELKDSCQIIVGSTENHFAKPNSGAISAFVHVNEVTVETDKSRKLHPLRQQTNPPVFPVSSNYDVKKSKDSFQTFNQLDTNVKPNSEGKAVLDSACEATGETVCNLVYARKNSPPPYQIDKLPATAYLGGPLIASSQAQGCSSFPETAKVRITKIQVTHTKPGTEGKETVTSDQNSLMPCKTQGTKDSRPRNAYGETGTSSSLKGDLQGSLSKDRWDINPVRSEMDVPKPSSSLKIANANLLRPISLKEGKSEFKMEVKVVPKMIKEQSSLLKVTMSSPESSANSNDMLKEMISVRKDVKKKEDSDDILKDYEKWRFLCPTCMKGFSEAEDLRNHMKDHNEMLPYKCHVCEERFTWKHTLKRHLAGHDRPKEPSKYTCKECGKSFVKKKRFDEHMKFHALS